MRTTYTITTDVARVYKARSRGRYGWGWATATIREWPKGGSIDVQSDFGPFAYSWGAIGDRTLREFLCSLHFDYFMGKAASKGFRVFDEEATIRRLKRDIFDLVACKVIDRTTAHDWRDDLDDIGECGNEHLFAERVLNLDWVYKVVDSYPSIVTRDCPQARAFWDGPWQALCAHWRQEISAEALAA